MELFPRLGYYFVSFRAIESQKTRERIRNLLDQEDPNSQDEGIVAEVNMYLVVFRDGICSVGIYLCNLVLVAHGYAVSLRRP